jgi:hypothetical protein
MTRRQMHTWRFPKGAESQERQLEQRLAFSSELMARPGFSFWRRLLSAAFRAQSVDLTDM